MWIRNKKTGRVCDAIVRERKNSDGSYSTIVCTIKKHEPGDILAEYYSLAKLYEEWEDYKPAEPLIKDPNIRKAVRAWAKAEGIEKVSVMCHLVWKENMTEIAKSDNASLRIVFSGDLAIKMGSYTIPELCGEEKE